MQIERSWHNLDPVTLCMLTDIHTAWIRVGSTSKFVSFTSFPSSSISFTMKSEYLKVGRINLEVVENKIHINFN